MQGKGRVLLPNRMIFRKVPKGGPSGGGGSFQYNFPKMRGVGGSKAVWNFHENSSDLVAGPFPNQLQPSHLIFFENYQHILNNLNSALTGGYCYQKYFFLAFS